MDITQPNKFTRQLRKFKRWGLPTSVLMILSGYIILNAWGVSDVQYRVDWYLVYTTRINGIGVFAAILLTAGIIFLLLWLIMIPLMKGAVPCPACGTLLFEKQAVCPHCKSNLSWGNYEASEKREKEY